LLKNKEFNNTLAVYPNGYKFPKTRLMSNTHKQFYYWTLKYKKIPNKILLFPFHLASSRVSKSEAVLVLPRALKVQVEGGFKHSIMPCTLE
jgi:hypothetical protein